MNEKKKKSANYALEMIVCKAGQSLGEKDWTIDVWGQVKEGFISPEQALDYAKDNKIQGTLRVVRVASALFGGDVVVPEPVYSLKKISVQEEKAKVKAKVGRKPRQAKVLKVNAEPTLTDPPPPMTEDQEPEPPLTEEENLPPVPDPIALG